MSDQMIFKRHEGKYMITTDDYETIKQAFAEHMKADKHGKSTICSLYYDTPDFRLIRRSIEKPVYKEKLRIRSYGVATPDTDVFVELKKKYQKVVYKRRISLPEKDAMNYLETGQIEHRTQVVNEIDYFKSFYQNLAPSMLLMYDREAYYGKEDKDFRVTFDTNVLWRNYDLTLSKGIYGRPLLEPNIVLMEVKTSEAIPLWFVEILSKNKLYKTSFSKYGTAYRTWFQERKQADNILKLMNK
ncbi:MAG: polyphosphate polymerase domain-containing protein [Agathobacter sp.]|nr:polyphosphate polymerase domain-containing protein [Agathobacter sp.]